MEERPFRYINVELIKEEYDKGLRNEVMLQFNSEVMTMYKNLLVTISDVGENLWYKGRGLIVDMLRAIISEIMSFDYKEAHDKLIKFEEYEKKE